MTQTIEQQKRLQLVSKPLQIGRRLLMLAMPKAAPPICGQCRDGGCAIWPL